MKILSKHKDYYDHLVSHYGYDSHIVYDRRNAEPLNYKGTSRFLFHICGVTIPVLKNRSGQYIFSPDSPLLSHSWEDSYDRIWMQNNFLKKTNLNAKNRQPVLCEIGSYKSGLFIPRLADFGFPAYYDAHEMYEKIYAFLGWLKDNPAPPDNQTDKEKIISHGFDKRTSFRPKIHE